MLGHHGHMSSNPVSDILVEHITKDLFQSFWMSLFVLSSLYSWIWDIYMDWGLGRPEVSEIYFERRKGYITIFNYKIALVSISRNEINVSSEKLLLWSYLSGPFPTVCFSLPCA